MAAQQDVHVPHIDLSEAKRSRAEGLQSLSALQPAATAPRKPPAAEPQVVAPSLTAGNLSTSQITKQRATEGKSCVIGASDSESSPSTIFDKVDANLLCVAPGRRPLVFVCNGAFNPIHRQHTRIFYLAREVRSN
jgi:hypothetical protein